MPSRNVTLGYSRYESWSFGVQISPVRSSRRPHTHTLSTHTHRALSANPFFALSRQGKCPVTRHHGLWLPARGGAFPLSLPLLFPLSPLMKPERRKKTAHARLDSNRGNGSPYPFSVTTLEKNTVGIWRHPSTDSARYLSASSRRPGGSEGARSIYPLPCPACCSCPSFDRSPTTTTTTALQAVVGENPSVYPSLGLLLGDDDYYLPPCSVPFFLFYYFSAS